MFFFVYIIKYIYRCTNHGSTTTIRFDDPVRSCTSHFVLPELLPFFTGHSKVLDAENRQLTAPQRLMEYPAW